MGIMGKCPVWHLGGFITLSDIFVVTVSKEPLSGSCLEGYKMIGEWTEVGYCNSCVGPVQDRSFSWSDHVVRKHFCGSLSCLYHITLEIHFEIILKSIQNQSTVNLSTYIALTLDWQTCFGGEPRLNKDYSLFSSHSMFNIFPGFLFLSGKTFHSHPPPHQSEFWQLNLCYVLLHEL